MKRESLCTISLIVGILSLVLLFVSAGAFHPQNSPSVAVPLLGACLALGVAAVILGDRGKRRVKVDANLVGRGFANAGAICGTIAAIFSIVLIAVSFMPTT